jgi:hypothetical protein
VVTVVAEMAAVVKKKSVPDVVVVVDVTKIVLLQKKIENPGNFIRVFYF